MDVILAKETELERRRSEEEEDVVDEISGKSFQVENYKWSASDSQSNPIIGQEIESPGDVRPSFSERPQREGWTYPTLEANQKLYASDPELSLDEEVAYAYEDRVSKKSFRVENYNWMPPAENLTPVINQGIEYPEDDEPRQSVDEPLQLEAIGEGQRYSEEDQDEYADRVSRKSFQVENYNWIATVSNSNPGVDPMTESPNRAEETYEEPPHQEETLSITCGLNANGADANANQIVDEKISKNCSQKHRSRSEEVKSDHWTGADSSANLTINKKIPYKCSSQKQPIEMEEVQSDNWTAADSNVDFPIDKKTPKKCSSQKQPIESLEGEDVDWNGTDRSVDPTLDERTPKKCSQKQSGPTVEVKNDNWNGIGASVQKKDERIPKKCSQKSPIASVEGLNDNWSGSAISVNQTSDENISNKSSHASAPTEGENDNPNATPTSVNQQTEEKIPKKCSQKHFSASAEDGNSDDPTKMKIINTVQQVRDCSTSSRRGIITAANGATKIENENGGKEIDASEIVATDALSTVTEEDEDEGKMNTNGYRDVPINPKTSSINKDDSDVICNCTECESIDDTTSDSGKEKDLMKHERKFENIPNDHCPLPSAVGHPKNCQCPLCKCMACHYRKMMRVVTGTQTQDCVCEPECKCCSDCLSKHNLKTIHNNANEAAQDKQVEPNLVQPPCLSDQVPCKFKLPVWCCCDSKCISEILESGSCDCKSCICAHCISNIEATGPPFASETHSEHCDCDVCPNEECELEHGTKVQQPIDGGSSLHRRERFGGPVLSCEDCQIELQNSNQNDMTIGENQVINLPYVPNNNNGIPLCECKECMDKIVIVNEPCGLVLCDCIDCRARVQFGTSPMVVPLSQSTEPATSIFISCNDPLCECVALKYVEDIKNLSNNLVPQREEGRQPYSELQKDFNEKSDGAQNYQPLVFSRGEYRINCNISNCRCPVCNQTPIICDCIPQCECNGCRPNENISIVRPSENNSSNKEENAPMVHSMPIDNSAQQDVTIGSRGIFTQDPLCDCPMVWNEVCNCDICETEKNIESKESLMLADKLLTSIVTTPPIVIDPITVLHVKVITQSTVTQEQESGDQHIEPVTQVMNDLIQKAEPLETDEQPAEPIAAPKIRRKMTADDICICETCPYTATEVETLPDLQEMPSEKSIESFCRCEEEPGGVCTCEICDLNKTIPITEQAFAEPKLSVIKEDKTPIDYQDLPSEKSIESFCQCEDEPGGVCACEICDLVNAILIANHSLTEHKLSVIEEERITDEERIINEEEPMSHKKAGIFSRLCCASASESDFDCRCTPTCTCPKCKMAMERHA